MAKTKKDSAEEPSKKQGLVAAEPMGHMDLGPMAAPPVPYPAVKRERGRLHTFDFVDPIRNQDWFFEADYANDERDRFPTDASFPGTASADCGWAQHILANLKPTGHAAVDLDTGAASPGSENAENNRENTVRQWFVDHERPATKLR